MKTESNNPKSLSKVILNKRNDYYEYTISLCGKTKFNEFMSRLVMRNGRI